MAEVGVVWDTARKKRACSDAQRRNYHRAMVGWRKSRRWWRCREYMYATVGGRDMRSGRGVVMVEVEAAVTCLVAG